MSDLFRLATEISLAHANGMRLAAGLPPIPPLRQVDVDKPLPKSYSQGDLREIFQDEQAEVYPCCGQPVGHNHAVTCPACTAEGKTCEGGIGNWDGLD